LKKRLFLVALTTLLLFPAIAQPDSCSLRISLLTCAPGSELYSTFGHTALRVQEPTTGTDQVYNYGTFAFGPDFYMQFIRGKLLYFLSVEEFGDFMYQYQAESRSVKEQVIQLDCQDKQKLLAALQLNAQEDNRYYRYDFLFDNCTTRAGDMVVNNAGAPVSFRNILPAEVPSFRDLIHNYLDAGHQYWSKLGIDLLLGAKLDRRVSNREAMFLPDYLMKGFDSGVLKSRSLVLPPVTILDVPSPLQSDSRFTPLVVFTLFVLLFLLLSFQSSKWASFTVSILDFLLFFVLGLSGILLLFMWFGTNHKVCANNYNLVWALPTHTVMAFFVHSHRRWVRGYFRVVCWISVILLLCWFFLPQQMNNALLPLVLLIIYRSLWLSKQIA
jgi:hypothetical protein